MKQQRQGNHVLRDKFGLRVMGCGVEKMKSYKDLEIYNLSYDLAIKIHRMSLNLPRYELYEEGSQVRRSSKAITSCIVEGYGRRRYDETILHLNFIKDTHEVVEEETISFLEEYDKSGGKINRFIQYVEKEWK